MAVADRSRSRSGCVPSRRRCRGIGLGAPGCELSRRDRIMDGAGPRCNTPECSRWLNLGAGRRRGARCGLLSRRVLTLRGPFGECSDTANQRVARPDGIPPKILAVHNGATRKRDNTIGGSRETRLLRSGLTRPSQWWQAACTPRFVDDLPARAVCSNCIVRRGAFGANSPEVVA